MNRTGSNRRRLCFYQYDIRITIVTQVITVIIFVISKSATSAENETVTLTLNGWLDTVSSPDLGAAIDKINDAKAIVFDFSDVEYMASSGLRQVVAAHKKAALLGATFCVKNVRDEVMTIFQMTGIDKKIKALKA